MIVHRPNVEAVELGLSGAPWDEAGVVAYALATIDGVEVGPFFLVRTPDGCLIPHYGFVPGDEIPACLLHPEIWEPLRLRFMHAIADLEAELDEPQQAEGDA